jgi:2,3-diketo-5-methylthio-1-phosphopentane phosphatase
MLPLIVVIDFDGTLTLRDVGDEICERFAPPAWRDLDDAWVRNEITLPEAQRRMWAMVRATREAATKHALAVGQRRPGLHTLSAEVAARGGELWLASGGFDFYIEALLGEETAAFAKRFSNRAYFDGDRVSLEFPHAELACGRCAVCKGRVCRLARSAANRVVFVGDGSSDRCAAGEVDELFAVRDGILHNHAGDRARPFTSLDEVAGYLRVEP